MADSTTLHSGYMPAEPDMSGSGGSSLAPDFEGSVPGDSGVISPRIMDDSIAYEYPGANQGNLEPTGSGTVKGS
jgi:hypothetical protein